MRIIFDSINQARAKWEEAREHETQLNVGTLAIVRRCRVNGEEGSRRAEGEAEKESGSTLYHGDDTRKDSL